MGTVHKSKRKDIWKQRLKLLKGLCSNILARDKKGKYFLPKHIYISVGTSNKEQKTIQCQCSYPFQDDEGFENKKKAIYSSHLGRRNITATHIIALKKEKAFIEKTFPVSKMQKMQK